jgi:hypothetical protein
LNVVEKLRGKNRDAKEVDGSYAAGKPLKRERSD